MSSFAYNPFTDNLDYRKGSGGLAGITFLEGNDSVPVESDSDGVIHLIGVGGVTVTGNPGTNTETISFAGSSVTWTDITSATQTLAVNSGYVTDRVGGVAYTLPATASFGDVIGIAGKLGAWSVAQNANQQIVIGSSSSTVGITGSISSTNVGDCVWLLCITGGASTVWRAINLVGNITVA